MSRTVEEIRVSKLIALKDQMGSVRQLADRLGKSESQVSQWLNKSTNSGTGKPRGMSATTARYIEGVFGKPTGWMDAETSETQPNVAPAAIATTQKWALAQQNRWQALEADGLALDQRPHERRALAQQNRWQALEAGKLKEAEQFRHMADPLLTEAAMSIALARQAVDPK